MNKKNQEHIKIIAERIKELRFKAGYTSHETFAQDFNFDRKGYWRLENGHNFTMKTLFRILDAHQLTLSEFFKDIDKKESK
ncbi:helix-turn-helix domain-containing protein [Seonamhaeicola marinus]|uniref:Helix-turn-helix transcriptional regulator n=1 Tax=Seonamhaeicola marinus TaxID=1912246 RepID=A0A5D0HXN0_9FLAO|nr:helix-turn-helix transcriptional regulator [Seonamhaeicola marinus]TYA74907.1 helix-turn-helix transcriptional regulator [Seonamhaeicola marinus]